MWREMVLGRHIYEGSWRQRSCVYLVCFMYVCIMYFGSTMYVLCVLCMYLYVFYICMFCVCVYDVLCLCIMYILEARCTDSCTGGVPWPGLCPFTIRDPSGDVRGPGHGFGLIPAGQAKGPHWASGMHIRYLFG
uniref:Uncharacterized protein n=1 Tax=Myotis myotis TaxID=51298 RepID=A0A7J7R704_MYOMY|nr:hypothetical protein mMyoMyo1_010892 [Myotis myotis]